MVESLPGPLQVIVWPLLGAVLILALRRLLPNWLRRGVALAAVLASLLALWSFRMGSTETATIFWQPINLFRTSPVLQPTALALFAGIVMAGVTLALVLGIRGARPRDTVWHGVVLVALAGVLLLVLAGNLLTLAMGSGLLDLALVTLAISADDGKGRIAWRMVVPGAASTLLILVSTVQMDAGVGTTSLAARDFPLQNLVLLGIAGLLRLLVFPLHIRDLETPEGAATLLFPMGAGIYLLARTQTIGPVLADRPWMLAVGGIALLAGGLMAWAGSRSTGIADAWSGIAIHQAGLALTCILVLRPPVPWSWAGLALALGLLCIWWAATDGEERAAQPRWVEASVKRLQPARERVKAIASARLPALYRWRESWLGEHATGLLLAIALLSLAGGPWTAGAVARWPFYATLLRNGQGSLLIAALLGDTLLAAGLWTLAGRALRDASAHRLKLGPLLSLLFVALSLLGTGLVAGRLAKSLGVTTPMTPDVSVWGLGFVFVLPWLVGAWLARMGSRFEHPLQSMQDLIRLDRLYRAAGQVGRALGGTVYWVSNVGEGEGWWGWALIVLAIGALFFGIH
jgi:hypothetical protein